MNEPVDHLRRRVKSIAGQLLFGTRISRLLAHGPIIFAFHRVNDRTAGDALTCGVAEFEAYCRFFRRHFHVVSLSDLVAKVEQRVPVRREVALTFDDGYLDNFECAAPILEHLGLPATFFVVTGFLGTNQVAWWDRDIAPPPSWMTWEHVRNLKKRGFDIGAQTVTHADLGAVTASEARREIGQSHAMIASELGAPPEHFAYPYGGRENITEENRRLIRDAGFRSCLSCYGGSNLRIHDPCHLARIPVSAWYVTPYQLGFELLTRST